MAEAGFQQAGGLGAELSQMVVHVKVSKAPPPRIGNAAKIRTPLPLEISWLPRKAIEESAEFAEIPFKFARRGTTACHWIPLGARRESMRPRQRQP